jgi:hypothetical protein
MGLRPHGCANCTGQRRRRARGFKALNCAQCNRWPEMCEGGGSLKEAPFMSRVPSLALISSLLFVIPACHSAAPAPLEVAPSSAAQTVDQGLLELGVAQRHTLVDGQEHHFLLQAAAAGAIDFVVASDVLLPSLRVVGPGSDGHTVAGDLDANTADLRAKLSVTAPAAGTVYEIFVTGVFDGDDRGEYQLRATGSGGGHHVAKADCDTRRGGAFVTVEVAQEFTFKVWVPAANEQFIADAQRNLASGVAQNVSFPAMVDGTDCDTQWSWTVDATHAQFSDFSVEVCDGTPEYIEANKADWFRAPGYYCPWGSKIVAVEERP